MKRNCGGVKENNVRWNGGVAEYPNHSEFKRMGKKIRKELDNKCQLCGNYAKTVHHLDGDKANHSRNNLKLLCNICHGKLHTGRLNESKWRNRYVITAREIVKKLKITYKYMNELHKDGKLMGILYSDEYNI